MRLIPETEKPARVTLKWINSSSVKGKLLLSSWFGPFWCNSWVLVRSCRWACPGTSPQSSPQSRPQSSPCRVHRGGGRGWRRCGESWTANRLERTVRATTSAPPDSAEVDCAPRCIARRRFLSSTSPDTWRVTQTTIIHVSEALLNSSRFYFLSLWDLYVPKRHWSC